MDKIKLKAYGKVNLGLDVVRKRQDGYHDLRMVMQTVDVYDDVSIEKVDNTGDIAVQSSTLKIPNGKDNLAYMAARLLFDEFNIRQGINININKRIPIAGGMAGGSSDCAAVLKGINMMFDLGLELDELMVRGVGLGADVPYCLLGGTAVAEGIGDILTPLPAPPDCFVVIAKPPISVSTAFVYNNIKPDKIKRHPDITGLAEAVRDGNLKKMSELMENVMEEITIPSNPVIQEIKDVMLDSGALTSLMTGSGPTVFGIYDNNISAKTTVEMLRRKKITEQLYLTTMANNINM